MWRGGWVRLRARSWILLLAIGIGGALVLTASKQDFALLEKIRVHDSERTEHAANLISDVADKYVPLGAPIGLLIWAAGAMGGKVRWRKLGLACLMATLLSGVIVNIFRMPLGRPRPFSTQADGFYFFHGGHENHSFPSGHMGASSATAAAIAGVAPVTAIPMSAFALTVGWSRVQLNQHHPIDVAVSGVIGTVCGLCFASAVPGAAIRLRRRKKNLRRG